MTSEELTKIREDKKLSKSDFAKLLGITPMLLGKYEKGSIAIPADVEKKLLAAADTAAAVEIEVKKTVRKGARNAKEAIKDTAAIVKEAAKDEAAATEIEVKKTVRKAGRKAKKAAENAVTELAEAVSGPDIIIQSPMGGYITPADIVNKVPKDTAAVYVRVDENKLYYVLKNGDKGDVDIW